MRIDHQHVVGIDENRRIGVHQGLCTGAREKNARGGLFDIEELRVCGGRHGPEPSRAVVAEFEQSGAGECAFYQRAEEIAARVAVRMRVSMVMSMVVGVIRSVHFGRAPFAVSFVG